SMRMRCGAGCGRRAGTRGPRSGPWGASRGSCGRPSTPSSERGPSAGAGRGAGSSNSGAGRGSGDTAPVPRGPGGTTVRREQSMSENGTAVYQRQHKRGLTMPQLSAIDLLASGKTDKETAELLNLSRTCVTKWRCYSPVFQAALNRRRAEIWGAAADRLRSLIPQALDVLAAALSSGYVPSQMKAALAILRLASFSAAQKIG